MIGFVSYMGQAVAVWLLCCVPGAVVLFAMDGRAAWSSVRRLVFRLSPVAVFFAVYLALVAWTARPSVLEVAVQHGESILRVEGWLHLDFEAGLSHWSLAGATAYYDWAQLFVTLGLLTWLAVVEGDVFWRCPRNSLGLIAAGGFLVFWLYPVAPPWVLPARFGIHSAGLANLSGVGDLLGAMPSLHTAWAGWAAMMLWAILPGRWCWVGFANVGVTALVVLVTGNHFVLDVVAGEALAVVACLAASRFEVWRHGPLRAEAMELVA